MTISYAIPTPLSYFASLVRSDEQFPLLEAAASLAQDEFPLFDVEHVLCEVDRLVARLKHRLPADASAVHRLRILNHFFFKELRFEGNVNHYYDPDNSYLNVVLQSRRGIPVSLAVLWLELAQSVGLAVQGLGFPGHFLVSARLSNGRVILDPMTGESLSLEALAERLEPYRLRASLPGHVELPLELYLQTLTPREIVARMLRNLKEIHRSQQDWQRLIAVQDRLVLLLPQAWGECRDRGLAYVEIGNFRRAIADLEQYLEHAQTSEDADAIGDRVAELRRELG